MAIRKPIVIVGGELQQLQTGDSISDVDITNITNDEAGAVVCGTPMYIDASLGGKKAQANAAGTKKVFGLMVPASTNAAAVGACQSEGLLSLTTGQWDAVTGQVGGLTIGAAYYLDAAAAGKLTATAPSTGGQYVAPLGLAISATDFDIRISPMTVLL